MTLRKQAQAIFRAAIKAADPVEAVLRYFRIQGGLLHVGGRRYRLSQFDRIFVIGAGKASASMAKAATTSSMAAGRATRWPAATARMSSTGVPQISAAMTRSSAAMELP